MKAGLPTARAHEATVHVSPDLACLEGHFPGLSVVPGFVQIGWVMDAARALTGGRADVAHVETLKFKMLLRPGTVVRVRVDLAEDGHVLTFRLWTDEGTVSTGRCRLRLGVPAG
ncbi:MAG: hypothetical protein ACREJG_12500 [Candidatus Rokuibacteriota bacterium]